MSTVLEATPVVTTMSVEEASAMTLIEVINFNVEKLKGCPTEEIVMAICQFPSAVYQKEKVLRYFLVESPLRAKDLQKLCAAVGLNRARNIAANAAIIREGRLKRGKPPRWGAVISS